MTYLVSGLVGLVLAIGSTVAVVEQASHPAAPQAQLYNYGTR